MPEVVTPALQGAEMSEPAMFKGTRVANLALGLGFPLITFATFYLALYGNEAEFLQTRVRRGGGLIKLIEQSIGWGPFATLMLLFGCWCGVYGLVSLWKAVDSTPDVTAHQDQLEFHPAVRRATATYDEISHWCVEIVSGHPVLWIHFNEPYWSLQGLFRRKTVKLEGGKEQVGPLFEYFANHPIMSGKFVR